jgi:hypothetical protein
MRSTFSQRFSSSTSQATYAVGVSTSWTAVSLYEERSVEGTMLVFIFLDQVSTFATKKAW